jgi:hypothetical protein
LEEKWGEFKNSIAISNIGHAYKSGTGVKRDIEKAIYYFKKSSEMNSGKKKLIFFNFLFYFLKRIWIQCNFLLFFFIF